MDYVVLYYHLAYRFFQKSCFCGVPSTLGGKILPKVLDIPFVWYESCREHPVNADNS